MEYTTKKGMIRFCVPDEWDVEFGATKDGMYVLRFKGATAPAGEYVFAGWYCRSLKHEEAEGIVWGAEAEKLWPWKISKLQTPVNHMFGVAGGRAMDIPYLISKI